MSDSSKYYLVLGMSSNNIIESLMIEGYDPNDAYNYIADQHQALGDRYPFIHRILNDLMELYRRQYKIDPSLSNFRTLIDTSDEISHDFIKVLEYPPGSIINACSYYQNHKKTIVLKSDLGQKSQPASASALGLDAPTPKPKIVIKAQSETKPKIVIKRKE